MLFLHLTFANLKMIVRNRQALFWALAFPLVFVFVFAMIGSFTGSVDTIGAVEDVDYADFVLPGIVLWGIMGNSVMGIAVALANYREKKILRRIKASPMKARTFFAAQVSAYLVLSLVQAAMLFGIGAPVMGVSISGNLPTIALLILVCNVVFLNLGFIVGAFSRTGAAASGMGNVIVLPLVMFSGVFFSSELLPNLLENIMRFLPLAPMVEILRGVTLSDRPLTDFPMELGLIVAWIALTSLIATWVFKLE